jgi:fructoselysine-6-P-deglycase FrlB-like protein
VLESPPAPWPPLVEAFQAPSLLLVGEGSSLLFPTGFARDLALGLDPSLPVHACGGRQAAKQINRVAAACLLSSSGATRELNDLLDVPAPDTRRIALFANPDAPLASRVPSSRVVLPRAERAVPATASVVAFALELATAAHAACGIEMQATLSEAARALRDTSVPTAFAEIAPHLTRLIISDPDGPLGAELALKVRECLGLGAQSAPGTLLLHGFEEVLGPSDLILWFHPPREDSARIARAIGRTGASLLTLGPPDAAWPLPDAGRLSPIVALLAGYRVIGEMARARGRDPARPQRVEKVGNPIA